MTNVLGSTSMALIRKDAFLRVGGFDAAMPSCQDWDLWTRLSEVGPFAIVPEPAFVYDTTGSGRISSDMTRVISGHRVMRDRAIAAAGTWTRRRRVMSRYHRRLAEIYLTEARRPFRAALEAGVSLLNMPSAGAAAIMALAAMRSVVPGRPAL
jgi:GT2 family glycosyltransferase